MRKKGDLERYVMVVETKISRHVSGSWDGTLWYLSIDYLAIESIRVVTCLAHGVA